jgi:hypothetical protein
LSLGYDKYSIPAEGTPFKDLSVSTSGSEPEYFVIINKLEAFTYNLAEDILNLSKIEPLTVYPKVRLPILKKSPFSKYLVEGELGSPCACGEVAASSVTFLPPKNAPLKKYAFVVLL